tara:strand:+ start:9600 stop:10409 length:810 start_codon:yes stop_codon:yes gene_type:complete
MAPHHRSHKGALVVWNMQEERDKFSPKVRDEVVKLLQNHTDIKKGKKPTYEKLSTDSNDAVTYPSPKDLELVQAWKKEEEEHWLPQASKNMELRLQTEENARQAGYYLAIGKKLSNDSKIKNTLKKYLIDAYIYGMEYKYLRDNALEVGHLVPKEVAEEFFNYKVNYGPFVNDGEKRRDRAYIAADMLMKMVNEIMPESKTFDDVDELYNGVPLTTTKSPTIILGGTIRRTRKLTNIKKRKSRMNKKKGTCKKSGCQCRRSRKKSTINK